jgi:EAL domain-containing protein (putative c-di-GMP-specific phosphodiesterase class I)
MEFKTLLNQIKVANIKIALDDFGLHPLTLNYLKDLSVNEVKLDKTFITKIGESSATEALVDGIIHLAHKLNFNVVAEGVETEAQHDAVVKMGCNHMQGYLFSKPLTEADLYSFYKKQLSLTAPLHINTENLQPLLS